MGQRFFQNNPKIYKTEIDFEGFPEIVSFVFVKIMNILVT